MSNHTPKMTKFPIGINGNLYFSHCNRPQLTMQQMVNEAWLLTFCHWTHGCDVNVVKNYLKAKQWIKGSLASLICETKSLSMQDLLIMITCSSKNVQSPETLLFKLTTFPYIHWVVYGPLDVFFAIHFLRIKTLFSWFFKDGEYRSTRLPCWPSRGQLVSHQRWISGNVIHVCLCRARIGYPLCLWNPEETSAEVLNRGISGSTIVTARKRNCRKVMFSQRSVCRQGSLPSHNFMGQADPPHEKADSPQ